MKSCENVLGDGSSVGIGYCKLLFVVFVCHKYKIFDGLKVDKVRSEQVYSLFSALVFLFCLFILFFTEPVL